MAQNYTGMRKGISLVEMTIAIILFAALATIALQYTKNVMNTDMTAKKARIAAVTGQADQLLQAYQIYRTETGTDPVALTDLNGSSAILSSIPARIKEMSLLGWQYAADYNGTKLPAFFVTLDLNGTMDTTSQVKSGKEYCAIFNREFNTSISLAVTSTTNFGTVGNVNSAKTLYGLNTICWSKDANTTEIAIFVP